MLLRYKAITDIMESTARCLPFRVASVMVSELRSTENRKLTVQNNQSTYVKLTSKIELLNVVVIICRNLV
jgi:hypothetical protein